jgi:hypothetical protein
LIERAAQAKNVVGTPAHRALRKRKSAPLLQRLGAWREEVTPHFEPQRHGGTLRILTKRSLSLTHFTSKADLRRHIERDLATWNEHPTPFVWTKPAQGIIRSQQRMLERISGTVR